MSAATGSGTNGTGPDVAVPVQRICSPRPAALVRDGARGEVLLRHARLSRAGRPVFCTPSQAELAGSVLPRASSGSTGKVIYPTREDAEAAARELEALGSRALRSYLCGRSRSGHFHLTTDGARTGRVPAQRRGGQRRDGMWMPEQRGPLSA